VHVTDILSYYSRPEIQTAMAQFARDREVVGTTRDGTYSKRPDTILYPSELLDRVKRGAVSFHCSVERWHQPMSLSTALRPDELNQLRKGFDIIIDLDAKSKLEHSTVAALAVCDFLADYKITPTVKFSGRRGWHIAIASEALPEKIDFQPTATRYPEIPAAVASFVKDRVRDKIFDALVSAEGGIATLAQSVPNLSELTPYAFVDIETNWGNRHLFRMPYSLHPKSWLVSVPVRLFKLKSFTVAAASPKEVKPGVPYLKSKPEEATQLVLDALDWAANNRREEPKTKPLREGMEISAPIPEENFPQCMRTLLAGIGEGRKRSLFTIISFLRAVNWKDEEIENKIMEWNARNPQPLPARMITTQLKWHARQSRKLLPANCDSELFYKSLGIKLCTEPTCRWKNPVNAAKRAYRATIRPKQPVKRNVKYRRVRE
jgi:hypothetical protein